MSITTAWKRRVGEKNNVIISGTFCWHLPMCRVSLILPPVARWFWKDLGGAAKPKSQKYSVASHTHTQYHQKNESMERSLAWVDWKDDFINFFFTRKQQFCETGHHYRLSAFWRFALCADSFQDHLILFFTGSERTPVVCSTYTKQGLRDDSKEGRPNVSQRWRTELSQWVAMKEHSYGYSRTVVQTNKSSSKIKD